MVTRKISVVDIIDHVLDKGIVIDYHARMSVGGIDTLITIEGRSLVVSIQTYLEYSDRLVGLRPGALATVVPPRRRS